MNDGLTNKVIVITGAANGLGRALAKEFYGNGCHLALLDIDFKGLEKIKSEIENSGQKITIHKADVSNEQSVIEARLGIVNRHERVDIVVNNAGISISQYFEQMDLPDYRKLFDINFWGTVYCSKHFLPDLKQRPDSRLVNVISDFAFMGFPGKTAYGSSKSAVWGFTNALKTELAGSNIKVCFVVPPPLDTGLIKTSLHIDDGKRAMEAAFLKKNGMPIDKAAGRIVQQVRKGEYRIVVGSMMFWIDLLARLFPTRLHKLIGANKKRIDFI